MMSMYILDGLFFSLPIIGVLLFSLIFECIRKERENVRPGRLPVMLLLLIPLTLIGSVLYNLTVAGVSGGLYEAGLKDWEQLLLPAAIAVLLFVIQLAARAIMRLLSLTKKNRLISLIVMLLLWTAEMVALFVLGSGGFLFIS